MSLLHPQVVEARYQELEDAICAWGQSDPAVCAVVIVGSRSRQDHPADAYSDLDVILYTHEAASLAARRDWPETFGEVWCAWLGQTGAGEAEWIVVFAGGLKVDFVLSPVAPGDTGSLRELLARSPYTQVLGRGVRVLFDRRGTLPGELEAGFARIPPQHPSLEQFQSLQAQSLVTAVRAARLVRRGDLWRAQQVCSGELKQCLLALLEWHSRARYGLGRDTWYDGRFLSEWADPRALQALPATFAAYDQAGLRHALLAHLEMSTWLAHETADALGYPDSSEREAQMVTHIQQILV